MKSWFFSLGVKLGGLFLLWGCVTEDTGRPEVEGLKDSSEDYLLSVWGKPDKKLLGKGGEKVLIFNKVKASKIEPLSGKRLETICDMELTFNQEKIVKKWRYLTCGKFKSKDDD